MEPIVCFEDGFGWLSFGGRGKRLQGLQDRFAVEGYSRRIFVIGPVGPSNFLSRDGGGGEGRIAVGFSR